MSEFLIIKLLHIIAFVYWLGGDLGTFYASRFVARPDLSPEARSTAMTIMMGCDQGPRFAMPLILPLGFHLAYLMGAFQVSTFWLAITWIICLAWVAWVATIHFGQGSRIAQILTAIDFKFRVAVVLGLGGLAIYALATGKIFPVKWVAYKLLVFAVLVGFGLMIRVALKPLIGAWGTLMTSGPTAEINATIKRSLSHCLPFVWGIWIGLVINAALGLHIIG